MMDKRLLDPRRPRTDKPTEVERQEGLVKYSPQLQQVASQFASYNRQIPRLKGAVLDVSRAGLFMLSEPCVFGCIIPFAFCRCPDEGATS